MSKETKKTQYSLLLGVLFLGSIFAFTFVNVAMAAWTQQLNCDEPAFFGMTIKCRIDSFDVNGNPSSSIDPKKLEIKDYGSFESPKSGNVPEVVTTSTVKIPTYITTILARKGKNCGDFVIRATTSTHGDPCISTSHNSPCPSADTENQINIGWVGGTTILEKTIEVCNLGFKTPTPSPSICPTNSTLICPNNGSGACRCSILPTPSLPPSPTIFPTPFPTTKPTMEPIIDILDPIINPIIDKIASVITGSNSARVDKVGSVESSEITRELKKTAIAISSNTAVKTVAIAVPVAASIPAAAPVATNMATNFFGVFFWKRKRDEHFVKAVDSLTGKGIGNVVIFVRTPDGKSRATWTTDNRTGNTGDLLPSGKYEFVAQKQGWKFPSSEEPQFVLESGDMVYKSGFIEINNNAQGTTNNNEPKK